MPTYEYRCKSCGKTHEIEHGFHDKRPTECPSCGGELVRVFHPIGLVFKGSGFHKTDYGGAGVRGQGDSKPAEPAKRGETSKPADAKPSDTKSTSGTPSSPKDSKPSGNPAKPSGESPKS